MEYADLLPTARPGLAPPGSPGSYPSALGRPGPPRPPRFIIPRVPCSEILATLPILNVPPLGALPAGWFDKQEREERPCPAISPQFSVLLSRTPAAALEYDYHPFCSLLDGSIAVSNDTWLVMESSLHWEQLIVFPPLPSQKDLSFAWPGSLWSVPAAEITNSGCWLRLSLSFRQLFIPARHLILISKPNW